MKAIIVVISGVVVIVVIILVAAVGCPAVVRESLGCPLGISGEGLRFRKVSQLLIEQLGGALALAPFLGCGGRGGSVVVVV